MSASPSIHAGEMAKFRLAPFGTVFSALKAMLDDFSGSNVDAVAELLDTAGRFLYRLPETHVRMANMADVRSCARALRLHAASCSWTSQCPPISQCRHAVALIMMAYRSHTHVPQL